MNSRFDLTLGNLRVGSASQEAAGIPAIWNTMLYGIGQMGPLRSSEAFVKINAFRCAKVLNSRYEWLANSLLAGNAGLLPEEIDAAASSGPVTGIDSVYGLLCKATDELSTTCALTDETLSEMLGQFDETNHANARAVLSTLTQKTMPPDGPFWPQDRLDLLAKWMSDGYQI